MKTFSQFSEDVRLEPVMAQAAMLFVELDIEPIGYLDEWVKSDPSLEIAWLEYTNERMLALEVLGPGGANYRQRPRQQQHQQPVATTAAQWPSMAPSVAQAPAAPVDPSAAPTPPPLPGQQPDAQGQQPDADQQTSPWQTAWSGIKQGAQQMWQNFQGPQAKFGAASKALNDLATSLQKSPGMENMKDAQGQPLLNTIQSLVKSLESQKGQIPKYQSQQATGGYQQQVAPAPV